MSLQGKIALVTGASRGLGEGAARALAKEGAKVMLVARDSALVQKVAREIGAEAMACDVSDYAATEQAVAATRKRFGGLDILVNNVGAVRPRPGGFLSVTDEDWTWGLTINFLAAVRTTRAARSTSRSPVR